MQKSQHLARLGELIAQKYLQQKGFRLITKNYFLRGGEIDLIMEDDDIMIFVEVKTRRNQKFGHADEAINPRKKRKLIRAVFHYLKEKKVKKPWRTDLVHIHLKGGFRAHIKHIPHIFLC